MCRMTLSCVVLLELLLCSGTIQAGEQSTVQKQPPNIVLIFSDDQGWNDVGCFGGGIPTPYIDSIAKNGLKFTQFYVASPVCTPSRYGLLTGRQPARSRGGLHKVLMPSKIEEGQLLPEDRTIAEVLKAKGYRTGIVGKWHLGYEQQAEKRTTRLPNHHGFDYFFGHESGCTDYFKFQYGELEDWFRNNVRIKPTGYATDVLGEEAVRFIKLNPAKQPFFLYVPFNAPHYGKGWDDKKKKRLNLLQAKPEDIAKFAHIKDEKRRLYCAMVKSMDDNIGRILGTLKSTGQLENTIVVFLTDHGGDPRYGGSNTPLRAGKKYLFEGGIRVPCVMQWPAVWKKSRTIDVPCSALDLLPTFATVAGLESQIKGATIDGASLIPIIAGERKLRVFYWKFGSRKAVRQGKWKYVYDAKSKEREFLFDLEVDPNETTNLKGQNASKLKELAQLHQRYFDTLLKEKRETSGLKP